MAGEDDPMSVWERQDGRGPMNIQSILATKGAHVITIRPEQLIREALVLFIRHNIGALVVLDDAGHLLGILSERDIIRAAPRNEAIFSQPVSAVMTRDIINLLYLLFSLRF